MSELDEALLKRVTRKFPCMNVIMAEEGKDVQGIPIEREIGKHIVTLAIGKFNVTVIDARLIKEED